MRARTAIREMGNASRMKSAVTSLMGAGHRGVRPTPPLESARSGPHEASGTELRRSRNASMWLAKMKIAM